MIEQLQAVIDAATALRDLPGAEWIDGGGSPDWLRRSVAREDAVRSCIKALDGLRAMLESERVKCCTLTEQARAAVLEDAERGDIK